jgi:hypothetical protein
MIRAARRIQRSGDKICRRIVRGERDRLRFVVLVVDRRQSRAVQDRDGSDAGRTARIGIERSKRGAIIEIDGRVCQDGRIVVRSASCWRFDLSGRNADIPVGKFRGILA